MENEPTDADTQTLPVQALPVRSVTLFTSGVGYVEHAGEVDGDAAVPLRFRTAQINDILKSLVLLDEKGVVRPVTYGARDPVGRTLQSFAVDVTDNQSRAELLGRLRGIPLAAETGDGDTIAGRIVGVETRTEIARESGGATKVTVEVLTLLGEDGGLRAVRLDAVDTLRLLDERLDRELREALSVLASGSDDQRRTVTLRFEGAGRRQVRVGYVVEAPLWKMSYRLVLGEGEKPYLQGWALVENTTDEDWEDVGLSLVSGRPISFIQDLYQPLYLPRPVVSPDIIASPLPQIHGVDLEEPMPPPAPAAAPATVARMRMAKAASPMAAAAPPMESPTFAAGGAAFRESVAPQASGQSAGELFQYNITTPVRLPRQQAAMIPVVAGDIEAEKLSLYNADTGPRFPLNAVRLANTTGLHLKGGPMTLFDEGVYAGDAKIEDIPPGDSRLVSYAVDLGVEGERRAAGGKRTEAVLSLRRGVLALGGRLRQETVYTLKSKAARERVVLVEHPLQTDFTLVEPASAAERTADRYRFRVVVPPGATETLRVILERPLASTIGILDADLNALVVYAEGRRDVPEAVRDALGEVVARRRRLQELGDQAEAAQAEIKAIKEDQERIRKNMAALEKDAALYGRYVAELDGQETRIKELRAEAKRLRDEAAEAERALRAFVDELDISG